VLCEIDILQKKFVQLISLCHVCGDWLLEYKYVQVWIIMTRRKQNAVGWFLESLQQT